MFIPLGQGGRERPCNDIMMTSHGLMDTKSEERMTFILWRRKERRRCKVRTNVKRERTIGGGDGWMMPMLMLVRHRPCPSFPNSMHLCKYVSPSLHLPARAPTPVHATTLPSRLGRLSSLDLYLLGRMDRTIYSSTLCLYFILLVPRFVWQEPSVV